MLEGNRIELRSNVLILTGLMILFTYINSKDSLAINYLMANLIDD